MTTIQNKAMDWKPARKFKPEEVKEAIANMPMEIQQRRVGPVLGIMALKVAQRVGEHLGEPGVEVLKKSAEQLSKQVGVDLAQLDLTKTQFPELLKFITGKSGMDDLDAKQVGQFYFACAAMLMKLSCDVLEKLGDEKGQHVIEQAWEEVAKEHMYWDLVADQFDLKEKDARTAIALLAGTDALMGVKFEIGKMTPTYVERNITFCTPVAMAWSMGYSHDTVRKFCETVATSVCIRGPQEVVPGVKVKYLTRMSYGDQSCIEVAEFDPKAAKAAKKA